VLARVFHILPFVSPIFGVRWIRVPLLIIGGAKGSLTPSRRRCASSTMLIEVSFSDTSNLAKYLMAAPARCLCRFDIDHVLTS
jgi:hypothetical protein